MTSEAIESLADAEPEPWSVQAVERAEAVADDAFAETKLAFPTGVARSMVEYELRDEDVCQMHSIDPKRLNAAPKWWTCDEYRTNKWVILRDTGVSRRSSACGQAPCRRSFAGRGSGHVRLARSLVAAATSAGARFCSTVDLDFSSSQPTKPPFSRVLLTDVATDLSGNVYLYRWTISASTSTAGPTLCAKRPERRMDSGLRFTARGSPRRGALLHQMTWRRSASRSSSGG